MFNLALGSIALMTFIPTVKAGSPVGYGVCVVTCIGVCEVAGISAGAVAGLGAGALAAESCPVACAAVCTPAFLCLSTDTSITVREDSINIQKNIKDIKAGDFVQTLKNTETYWTKVLSNTQINGEIDFVRITVTNLHNISQTREIEVTPEHELVMSRANNLMTINAAKYIQIDDVLIDSIGNRLSVTSIDKIILNEKHNLITQDGTVLASDIFVTTMCNDGFEGERLFNPTIDDWQDRHSIVGELLPIGHISDQVEHLLN